ncbi:Basic 7S globulin [Vitis vinifera]|uniref:Basic 7S globulin n=1 Tax=Vitis vinifera TaxID=29760 RepID=A0A438EZW3_VITVI|nr:Basic 7S globulin [Vitis vinifera]
MASLPQAHLFSLILLSLTSFSVSQTPLIHPNALVLPLTKHASTLQYVTIISQRTPLVPLNVIVDLGGQFLWVGCGSNYVSSSYRPAQCHSSQCFLAHGPKSCDHCLSRGRPKCNNGTCILFSENVFTSKVSAGDLSEDVLSLQSTDGLNPRSLGHGRIGLPTLLSSALNFTRKFAVCLPPTTTSSGVIFFGDGPYALLPGIDVSKLLIYTPLIKNPRSVATRVYVTEPLPSYEYFIRVKSIQINGKQVPLDSSLLAINKNGIGGTKISTVNPYTLLQTSIYNSFTKLFLQEAMAHNVTRVSPVAPFDVCFSTKNTNGAFSTPAIPVIDLVLQNKKVFWRIFETNSMVLVGDDVACLGFLDGGLNQRTSIVIGGHQLEDNLLQFDLESSRLGFTSSLLLRETSCANFNFTSSL